MSEVDYSKLGFQNPKPEADVPYNPPKRVKQSLNTALHGAGSAVEGSHLNTTRSPAQRHAGQGEAYGGNDRPPRSSVEKPPSEKSAAWLRDLLTKREIPHKQLGSVVVPGYERAQRWLDELDAGELSQAQVSRMIDEFKDCPRKGAAQPQPAAPSKRDEDQARVVAYLVEREAQGSINEFGQSLLDQFRSKGRLTDRQIEVTLPRIGGGREPRPQGLVTLPKVPAGRYAVENIDGELTFYRVWYYKDGRVNIYLKHGPQESLVPFTGKGYATILQSIVDYGPFDAALRYGRELKCCSVCSLDLTNRLSRELGIGPVCGNRYFEDPGDWKRMKAHARSVIRARGEDPNEVIA